MPVIKFTKTVKKVYKLLLFITNHKYEFNAFA